MKTLSKSTYVAGLQCHKLLWWKIHEPKAPELVPDSGQQAIYDRGQHVGAVARTYVPGGTLIDRPHYEAEGRINDTREAIKAGAKIIYEASFSAHGVFCAADILERRAGGWHLVEVKSTLSVKDEHLPDAAIQTYILSAAGLELKAVELMHLNRECRYPDLRNLFVRENVTAEVKKLLPQIPRNVSDMQKMLAGRLPRVEIGPHCTSPYNCPFISRCWPEESEHHVNTLYRQRSGKREQWLAEGIETIFDIPGEQKLSGAAERQRKAVVSGKVIVEPGLRKALEAFKSPLAFLDFETVAPAIPCWRGCRPYGAVPVQYSCHVECKSGRYDHHEFLAPTAADPREDFTRELIAACKDAASIVVYSGFEKARIRELAKALPKFAPELQSIENRLVDLLPVVQNNVYHPDFHGSFSIKSVLPALVPKLAYDDLEIAEGGAASDILATLLFARSALSDEQCATWRKQLLRYCKRDTEGMYAILDRLRGLV